MTLLAARPTRGAAGELTAGWPVLEGGDVGLGAWIPKPEWVL